MAKDKNRIKDPKKVAAGKARAAKSLRVDGKFTSNAFFYKVERDAQASGVKDPFKFFLQNEAEYSAAYTIPGLTTSKDIPTLIRDIKNYQGKKILKNGREVKKNTAIKFLSELQQYLKSEHNVAACWGVFEIYFDGKLNLIMPSISDIEKMIDSGQDIEEIAEQFDLTIIISDPKDTRKRHLIKNKSARLTICRMKIAGRLTTLNIKEVDCKICLKLI